MPSSRENGGPVTPTLPTGSKNQLFPKSPRARKLHSGNSNRSYTKKAEVKHERKKHKNLPLNERRPSDGGPHPASSDTKTSRASSRSSRGGGGGGGGGARGRGVVVVVGGGQPRMPGMDAYATGPRGNLLFSWKTLVRR